MDDRPPAASQPPPTIQDVAQEAGVSTATVSRALNRPQDVSDQTRRRVMQTVERLGYVAHAGARALTLRRSRTVGVVVPTIDNAIFATGLQAFQRRMAREAYVSLLAFSDYDPAQELAQAQALVSRGVDALALTGASQKPELIALLQQRGLPWVHTLAFPAPDGAACVGIRNREAMARAMRYLLDLGHRRIGVLSGIRQDNDRVAERVEGAREALLAAGLPVPQAAFIEASYELSAAREATRRLLARYPATALLCGQDVLAWGAILECRAQGLEVPSQISVVGFDDLPLSRHWEPALTTVQVPTERMWVQAAELLLARLGQGEQTATQQEVPVELVVRASTAPPPPLKRRRR